MYRRECLPSPRARARAVCTASTTRATLRTQSMEVAEAQARWNVQDRAAPREWHFVTSLARSCRRRCYLKNMKKPKPPCDSAPGATDPCTEPARGPCSFHGVCLCVRSIAHDQKNMYVCASQRRIAVTKSGKTCRGVCSHPRFAKGGKSPSIADQPPSGVVT